MPTMQDDGDDDEGYTDREEWSVTIERLDLDEARFTTKTLPPDQVVAFIQGYKARYPPHPDHARGSR